MSYLKSQVKLALKTVVPYDKLEKVFAIYRTVNISSQLKLNRARKVFEQATHKPVHLDPRFLDILQKEYSINFVESVDTNTLLKRGKQQVKELLDVIRTYATGTISLGMSPMQTEISSCGSLTEKGA